jgi:hypothetical protein
MFEKLFKYRGVQTRHRNAPLAPQRVAYLSHRAEQGSAKATLLNIARELLVICRYVPLLPRHQIDAADIEVAAQRWARRSPHLGLFESTPEVRALPSTGITRLQRYYDPLRVPAGPPSISRALEFTSARPGVPPLAQTTFPACRAHYPGGPFRRTCRSLAGRCCLPRYSGGSASTTSLSRPAQASLKLRPAGLLSHPRRPLSQGSNPARYQAKSLVSYQTYRLLSGWDFHPPVICAVGAH